MSQRRLRDELRDVFDSLSEPAHPALSARIREQIASPPAPANRAPRLAVAVALLVAVVIVASLVFVSRHAITTSSTPGAVPTPAASPTPAATPLPVVPVPTASAAPTPQPGASGAASPPASSLPAFSCAAQSGQGATSPPVGVTAVRADAQSGYDRFVIQFDGPVPRYDVAPVAGTTFTRDPSGLKVTLAGSAGLGIVLHGAQGAGSYTGPTDLRPTGTSVLREAAQTGDFEGVVHWSLGLSRAACFRAFTLTGPPRLVVDIQAS